MLRPTPEQIAIANKLAQESMLERLITLRPKGVNPLVYHLPTTLPAKNWDFLRRVFLNEIQRESNSINTKLYYLLKLKNLYNEWELLHDYRP